MALLSHLSSGQQNMLLTKCTLNNLFFILIMGTTLQWSESSHRLLNHNLTSFADLRSFLLCALCDRYVRINKHHSRQIISASSQIGYFSIVIDIDLQTHKDYLKTALLRKYTIS